MNRKKSAIQKKIVWLLPVIIIFLLSYCHTPQQVVKPERDKKPRPISIKKLQSNVEDAYLDYENLELKFSARIMLTNTKYSVKGQIRIRKDSVIWINMSHATGVPVAKVLLKPDSIIFLNRISNEYYSGDYSFLERVFLLDLNYYYFQAFFLDELFTYPEYEDVFDLKKGDYKDKIDSNLYCLKSLKDRKVKRQIRKDQEDDLIVQDIYIEPDSFKIVSVYIHEFNLDRTLIINYGDFQYFGEKLLPNEMELILKNDTDRVELSVKYTKITSDKDLDYPCKIPEKYTRIE